MVQKLSCHILSHTELIQKSRTEYRRPTRIKVNSHLSILEQSDVGRSNLIELLPDDMESIFFILWRNENANEDSRFA